MEPSRKAASAVFKQQVEIQQEQEPIEELMDEETVAEAVAQAPKTEPAVYGGYGAGAGMGRPSPLDTGLKTSEEMQLEKEPIRVRETGALLWRRVIVPPNAYVVHTRIGRSKPVTLGMGVSFRHNPRTDAYLVVPAAMQTIGVVANCITKEKQGINVLAYVQWQIDDFSAAYRKLDFSDSRDPLGIVNAQLSEQTEAAIKDKIATMSVEDVLTDKAPIIEELTTRLKSVAEGRRGGTETTQEGLGIKIVTVQIKEAFVSSQRLWQHLQAPFRNQQETMARISHLTMQNDIRKKELESRKATETSEAETMVDIERIKQTKQTEAMDLKLTEESARFMTEQETAQKKIKLEEQTTLAKKESDQRLQIQAAKIEKDRKLMELQQSYEEALERVDLAAKAETKKKKIQTDQSLHAAAEEDRLAETKMKLGEQQVMRAMALGKREAEAKLHTQEQVDLVQSKAQEAELARQREEHRTKLHLEAASNRIKLELREREMELARLNQEIRNLINQSDLQSRIIEKLPELAAKMPDIQELKVLQTGESNSSFDLVSSFLARMLAIAEHLGIQLTGDGVKPKPQRMDGEAGREEESS